MARRIVVIGGVAAGMSAASQARRRLPTASVVVLEKGPDVSYGACGIPYNIESTARSISDLVVITRERFLKERGIEVRTRHQALAIDATRQSVSVRDLEAGRDYDEPYDELCLTTGARAIRPPLPGLELSGVFVLRELSDGAKLKDYLKQTRPARAVIVGAGYIGMEMAEALSVRGLAVTIVEKMPRILPGYDPAITEVAVRHLLEHGVLIDLAAAVRKIERGPSGLTVSTSGGCHEADLVLIAVGVEPNIELARAAGIRLGTTGAIAVDDHMRTNVPHIFAAGDCAEAHHLVLGEPAYVPLGTTANKQGRIAGANAAGADRLFRGIVGTAGFKLFDLEVARTGLGPSEVERKAPEALRAVSLQSNRGHGYPGAGKITTVLYADRASGRLLGAQMIGPGAVATRVDVFATALHAQMTIDDLASLDLAYAPPFAPVYDPILIAATVAKKELARAAAE